MGIYTWHGKKKPKSFLVVSTTLGLDFLGPKIQYHEVKQLMPMKSQQSKSYQAYFKTADVLLRGGNVSIAHTNIKLYMSELRRIAHVDPVIQTVCRAEDDPDGCGIYHLSMRGPKDKVK